MTEKTKVIAFSNNKGGSGKSTTCSNVGYSLALLGNRVLLVDSDMQQNLSLSFFAEDDVLAFSKNGENLYTALKNESGAEKYIKKTKYENLDILPAGIQMSCAEYELYLKKDGERTLSRVMKDISESGEYDFILIDSPPSLGMLAMNIMCAADYLVIPVEASPWGLFGLANMLEFVQKAMEISPKLSLLGVALTKADERKSYFRQTVENLSEIEGVRFFKTFIRVDSAIEWSQDNSMPVAAYKKSCRSAKEYIELTKEIIGYVGR